tara:strand:+ start:2667 stop:2933 length:267 start_codon:yes stop_codon:yes gene_type:complete
MTNYDIDELQREKNKNWPQSVQIGKDEEPWTAINVEIPEKDFLKIAREAHTRDITVNKLVNVMIKNSMKKLEYRYEHNNEPQLLNEDI